MAKKELAKKPTVVRVTTKEDKKTALDGALKQIEKKYGAGAVMRLGQTKTLNVDAIPTGSMTLDMALGIGGVPRGRIVEVYGPESSGKTTVALSVIAQAQKAGGEAAFIDVEHPFGRYRRNSSRFYRCYDHPCRNRRRNGRSPRRTACETYVAGYEKAYSSYIKVKLRGYFHQPDT